MSEPMTPETRPVVASLGKSEAFRAWLTTLEPAGLRLVHCDGPTALTKLTREEIVALLLVDGSGGLDGASLLDLIQSETASVPVIEVVEKIDPARVVALMSRGLGWVVPRSVPASEIVPAVRALSGRRMLERTNQRLVEELTSRMRIQESWGRALQRAVDELLHELKTPAAVLQGFCSNLLEGIDGGLELKQRVTVERMRAAIELVTDLLTNARQRLPGAPGSNEVRQASARRHGRRPMHVEELVEQVRGVFAEQATAGGIEIVLEREGEIPEIWGDRTRLGQLLVNLLSNAVRHSPRDSQVRIRLAPEPGETAGRTAAVRITLIDAGPGIDAADHSKVFESGWSGDGRTGLGLAIAKQVAMEHQADLRLENTQGAGATFVLTLPVDPRARQAKTTVQLIDDTVLLGQLLIELRERALGSIAIEEPADMEELATQILRSGGALVLGGELDASLRRTLAAIGEPS